MRKSVCIFMLSIMFALACSSDVEAFKKAFGEWIKARPDALDLFKQSQISYQYFDSVVGNTTCASEVSNLTDNVTQQAADQWDADKSKMGDIASNLLNVVFPSIIVKFKQCANPDLFRRDEANFKNATAEVMEQNPFISKKYDDFSDEIGFLTKGQLPQNDTCVKLVANFVEFHRLSGIAQYVSKVDPYTIIAKLVYAKTTNFTKMAQRCLLGPDFNKFNSAFAYYFYKDPTRRALYDQEDDMISALTKILPHDEQCVKKISDKLTARITDAYASFGSGMATISELAGKFLYVYLPEGINEAQNCLTN